MPIRDSADRFTARLEGNGHTLANLFIDRSQEEDVGLFGRTSRTSAVHRVALVNVQVTGNSGVGGLVGTSFSTIAASHVTGTVTGVEGVGGLVGSNQYTIFESYSTATVTGEEAVGGLVGDNGDTIFESYSTATVTGEEAVGGLVGDNAGWITESYATGHVSGVLWVGGLVGANDDTITFSYATGRVSGGENVGGLVGINNSIGGIRGSYATSRVSGEDDVGGLAGDNRGAITAGYATGRVSGIEGVGGLVGFNQSTGEIHSGYATGHVVGEDQVGGLVGANDGGTIAASYWDTSTSGHATDDHGTGQTTAQLQAPTDYDGIYADWNVDLDGYGAADDPWHFGTDSQYPALKADFNERGKATWQEFGYQLREGPTLEARGERTQVGLGWTAVDASHWSAVPSVTHTVYRDDGDTVETLVEDLSERQYTDTSVTVGATYIYQVAAVIQGGEATRSAWVSMTVPDTTAPMVSHDRDYLQPGGRPDLRGRGRDRGNGHLQRDGRGGGDTAVGARGGERAASREPSRRNGADVAVPLPGIRGRERP